MPMSPRLLRPRATAALVAVDADARAYINAVRIADNGQYMEAGVQRAIDAFVIGCKTDGNWSAIKASCILCGARTLSGALTPLVGTAPTNFNFVSGDYNRKTGLVGDGSTKYLDTNRANNADGQNDFSQGFWITTLGNLALQFPIGVDGAQTVGASHFLLQQPPDPNNRIQVRNRVPSSGELIAAVPPAAGFYGTSRSSSAAFQSLLLGNSFTTTISSGAPSANTHHVFNRNASGFYSNSRLGFYWIGSSLTLSSLSSRVDTLITAIGAAIP